MLTLTGIIRQATTLGGGTDTRTGDRVAERPVLQVEGTDHRGLVQLYTLTVPDIAPYVNRIGERIEVPVRAWALKATVNLSYDASPKA